MCANASFTFLAVDLHLQNEKAPGHYPESPRFPHLTIFFPILILPIPSSHLAYT